MYSQPDSALKIFDRLEEIAVSTNYQRGILLVIKDKGILYKHLGKYTESLSLLFKALELNRKLSAPFESSILNNIANVYIETNDNEKAIFYLKNAAVLNEKKKHFRFLATNYNNIGIAYNNLKNPQLSILYHQKAMNLRFGLGRNEDLAQSFINISENYFNRNLIDSALYYSKEALQICDSINSVHGLAFVHSSLAGIYLKKDELAQALFHAEKGYEFSILTKNPETLLEASFTLSGIYKRTGNYKKSLEFSEIHHSLKDSLFNLDNTKDQLMQEYQNELNIKKTEQDKKDALMRENASQQKFIRNMFIAGFVLMLILAMIIFRGYRNKKKSHKAIEAQKAEVELQKDLVEAKQKEILDSIHYAQRIQGTLLANDDLLRSNLKEHFILYNPKDIVSGDFYWAMKKEDQFYLAVCDSTGHGVPGAFMSLLNISFLHEALNEKNLSRTDEVLNYVRKRLINNISHEGAQDGMDGILISLGKNNQLEFSAAHNSLVLIRNGSLQEFRGDKMPVGSSPNENISFGLQHMDLQKDDILYLFTDGYADQFGGPKGKKFKHIKLKDLLLSISGSPMMEQKEKLHETLIQWKGSLEQVDDILVIGIKI